MTPSKQRKDSLEVPAGPSERTCRMATICLLALTACFMPPTHAAKPGGVYTFSIPGNATEITYAGKPVFVIGDKALVAIPMTAEPGTATLKYRQAGQELSHEFTVRPHTYTEQHITIANEALVSPPAEVSERIQREAVRQRRLYAHHAPEQTVSSGFVKPLEGITTSLFGHRRFFNGKPRSPHSGLDIAAASGAPIAAAGDGIITLADELYFNGNTLFIDHGRGLITMYCHMSKLEVAEGDRIKKGQTIGLVGATGRATGPHLHWTVSLNGTRVDPLDFTSALNDALAGSENPVINP